MNQDRDGVSRKPQSSSSSNTAGTHALRITIEPEPVEPPAAAPAEGEQAASVPADAADISNMPEADHVEPPVSDELAAIAVAAELGAPVTDAPVAVTDEPVAVADAQATAPEILAAVAESDTRVTDAVPTLATEEPNPAPVAGPPATEPVIEAVAAVEPEPSESSAHAAGELPEAVRETLADTAAKSEQTVAAVDEMSHALSALMDDARHDATLIGRKLMEFVQANFENNIEMARNYAGARSVPEIVNVHTAYVRRQIDLLSRQAEEFRTLTSDLTAKRVSKIQSRLKA